MNDLECLTSFSFSLRVVSHSSHFHGRTLESKELVGFFLDTIRLFKVASHSTHFHDRALIKVDRTEILFLLRVHFSLKVALTSARRS